MKTIELIEGVTFKSRDVIKAIAENGNGQGLKLAEIRKRTRILDALEAQTGSEMLLLEDADHALLVSLLNEFPFAMAHKELTTIADKIEKATELPTAA